MGAFIKRTVLGFSLLELMVVVAIIGVLATVAVPRFNIFRARSRQAEAKSNLGVIFTLQESFAIDHEKYYNGVNGTWGGDAMDSKTTRDGYAGSGGTSCTNLNNKLGFRLANCAKARYGYFINGAGENGFLAISYGASDVVGDKRVYPGCDGAAGAVSRKADDDTGTNPNCIVRNAVGRATGGDTFTSGDAWCLDERREVKNYRDITEYCG